MTKRPSISKTQVKPKQQRLEGAYASMHKLTNVKPHLPPLKDQHKLPSIAENKVAISRLKLNKAAGTYGIFSRVVEV